MEGPGGQAHQVRSPSPSHAMRRRRSSGGLALARPACQGSPWCSPAVKLGQGRMNQVVMSLPAPSCAVTSTNGLRRGWCWV
jgi:hypothetical protein